MRGVREVQVDGEDLPAAGIGQGPEGSGAVIPLVDDGRTRAVQVVLG